MYVKSFSLYDRSFFSLDAETINVRLSCIEGKQSHNSYTATLNFYVFLVFCPVSSHRVLCLMKILRKWSLRSYNFAIADICRDGQCSQFCQRDFLLRAKCPVKIELFRHFFSHSTTNKFSYIQMYFTFPCSQEYKKNRKKYFQSCKKYFPFLERGKLRKFFYRVNYVMQNI